MGREGHHAKIFRQTFISHSNFAHLKPLEYIEKHFDVAYPLSVLEYAMSSYEEDNEDEDEDNYAEEVRSYELNRRYRDHDEYCDYASNDSEDLDYQYSEDNGYDPH